MKRTTTSPLARSLTLVAATAALVALCGCGNPVDRLLADEALRTQLWDRIAGDPALAGQVVDRLLGADSTRAALLDRLMTGGGSRQAVLTRVATDRSMMEGAIQFAVQDTAMRGHLMTLFRGMQMASAPQ